MSTFFVLLLILSAVGVWYFIKKKPDKKMRNYSIIALLVCFVLVGVTSPDSGKSETTEKEVASKDTASKKESEQNKDSSKQDLPLELDSLDIETDKDGNAVKKYNHLNAVRKFCEKYAPELIPVAKEKKIPATKRLENW